MLTERQDPDDRAARPHRNHQQADGMHFDGEGVARYIGCHLRTAHPQQFHHRDLRQEKWLAGLDDLLRETGGRQLPWSLNRRHAQLEVLDHLGGGCVSHLQDRGARILVQ